MNTKSLGLLHRQVVPICLRLAPSSRNFTLVGNKTTGGTFERTKSSLRSSSCFLAGIRPLLKVECQIGCQMGVKYGQTFFFETVHILCVCFLICDSGETSVRNAILKKTPSSCFFTQLYFDRQILNTRGVCLSLTLFILLTVEMKKARMKCV